MAPEKGAFTLLEVLVTMALLLIVMVTLLEFMTSVDQVWKSTAVDPFSDAENAFEAVANHLTSATLEPYQDYADSTGTFRTAEPMTPFVPDHLARRSDLAFVCGSSTGSAGWLSASGRTTAGGCLFFVAAQGYTQTEAHLGLEHLLNALGYFVEFSDENNVPAFILNRTPRWRWRLKEIVQPAESLGIYSLQTSMEWVQSTVQAGAPVSVLADNIVALIALPERAANDPGPALSSNYGYDSRDAGNPLTRNALPARLRLALVAIDEASAQILASQNGSRAPVVVPGNLFTSAAQLDADLASLDAMLTGEKIRHRIFQREILLPAADWTNTLSQ